MPGVKPVKLYIPLAPVIIVANGVVSPASNISPSLFKSLYRFTVTPTTPGSVPFCKPSFAVPAPSPLSSHTLSPNAAVPTRPASMSFSVSPAPNTTMYERSVAGTKSLPVASFAPSFVAFVWIVLS